VEILRKLRTTLFSIQDILVLIKKCFHESREQENNEIVNQIYSNVPKRMLTTSFFNKIRRIE